MRGFAAVIAMLKSQFSPTYISGLEIKKQLSISGDLFCF